MKKQKGPLVFKGEEREKSLQDDTPAVFKVERDPKSIKSDLWDEIRTFDSNGRNAVKKYDHIISKSAQKNNLDPDIIRSVMYAENARGHKFGLNDLADAAGISESLMPMNIQQKKWSRLIDKKPDDLYDPEHNIEASAVLLKRIANRVQDPTPEKIGTLWNSAYKDKTSIFGEYVRKVYDEKPWRHMD